MKFLTLTGSLVLTSLITATPATCFADDSLNTFADEDGRNTIVLRPKERAMMLEDMRNYLHGIKRITLAIAKEDLGAVEKAARSMGQIAIYDVKPMMSATLVPKFRNLAFELHNKFEALADAAATGNRQPLQLLGDLSLLMNQCVKCHETFAVGDFSH